MTTPTRHRSTAPGRMMAAAEHTRATLTDGTARLRRAVRGPSRSTTRRTLLGLTTALLLLTILIFATGRLIYPRWLATADTVRTRTAPAILEIATARAALVRADTAAAGSFKAGVQLVGPGEEFQNQVAIAGQSLTRVAAYNAAGAPGSRDLQLIEGLLVTYAGLIGQADAHFRQADGETLGAVDLWSASRLLHKADGGVLAQLDALMRAHEAALDRQLVSGSPAPAHLVALLAPIVALAGLLALAHLLFRRRFRRRLNPWLISAAVLLAALTAASAGVVVSQRHLEPLGGTLHRLASHASAQTAATDAQGQATLRNLVRDNACDPSGLCGDTVQRFVNEGKANGQAGHDDTGPAEAAREATAKAAEANTGADLEPLIYGLDGLIALAVLLGFRARLIEYRYRRT